MHRYDTINQNYRRSETVDIRALKTFILVSELSSFTKTAEKLGYAQSTVSSQIKQLEEELDVQLFERINRTVSLTERGKDILKYAHEIVNLSNKMREENSKEDRISGHITFVTADSMCNQLLGEAFLEFHRRYPEATVTFMTAGTGEMMRLLNHNEADLIFTLDNHLYSTEYIIAYEEKVGVHFVANRNHPLADKEEVYLEDLLNEDMILTEKGMSYRRILDEKLASMSLEITPFLETGNANQICWLIEQGLGISLLPDYATEKAVEEGNLVYLKVKDFEIDIWKQLLYHKDKWLSPLIQTVIEYCSNL